jgi:hypothetical protein
MQVTSAFQYGGRQISAEQKNIIQLYQKIYSEGTRTSATSESLWTVSGNANETLC